MLAITSYQWYLFFHVAASCVWVGGAVYLAALSFVARRQSDQDVEVSLVRLGSKIGGPFFGVSGLVVLAFGIALVEKGSWGWGKAFVTWGLCVWIASMLIGALFYGRNAKRIEEAHSTGNEVAVRALLDRYYLVGRLDVLVLLSAVFAMSVKPFL